MGVFAGPDLKEDGLVLCLDAGNNKSYVGSGITWTDISGIPLISKIGGTVNEGGNLTLTAPSGGVITNIDFASYGTPTGTYPNFSIGGCHATNSFNVVNGLAFGKTSVTIPATNSTFGDPCPGTGKALAVVATTKSSYISTLTNGPTYSSSNGGSIVFDGVDDKVTFPNITISTIAGITVEVWFKTSSGTKYQDIFDLGDEYGIWIVTNYSASGKINTSFNTLTGYMTADYVANNWYQVVLSGSGTSNFMYLNGVQVATASQTVATSINLNTARIGNVDGDRSSEYLVGNVATLKIYNRALSAQEIQQNYNTTKSRFGL